MKQIKLLQERGPWKYSHFLLLKLCKLLMLGFHFPDLCFSRGVDIVYVVHNKDAGTLTQSIESLGLIKNITINNIFIITNDLSMLKGLIRDDRVSFISEVEVLGFSANHYQYPLESTVLPNRSGWLYQQFLKLGWAYKSPSDNYIVIDADTHFIEPISFFDKSDRFIFFGTEEWWPTYFAAFFLMFNEKHKALWSRTAHMMVFNRQHVLQMLAELESLHDLPWHEVIAKTRSLNSHACFSEYETYANWMLLRYPNECSVRPSYNANSKNPKLNRATGRFNSVSAHTYLDTKTEKDTKPTL